MLSKASKSRKLSAILVLIAMVCMLVPVSTASASCPSSSIVVNITFKGPNDSQYVTRGCTGESGSYIIDVSNISGLTTNCLTANSSNTQNGSFIVNFPTSFDLSPVDGLTVPVKLHIFSNSDPQHPQSAWVLFQPTAVVGTATNGKDLDCNPMNVNTVKLNFTGFTVPFSGSVDEFIIGDANQNLEAVNPCTAGTYPISIYLDQFSCTPTIPVTPFTICQGPYNATKTITVIGDQESPASICRGTIVGTIPDGYGYVFSCCSFSVSGAFTDCGSNGFYKTGGYDVTIQGSWPNSTYHTTTNSSGEYSYSGIPAPNCVGTYTVTASIDTGCDCGPLSVSTPVYVLPRAPVSVTIDDLTTPINCYGCNSFVLRLRDNCCTPVGNATMSCVDRYVYLSAFTNSSPPMVAAHFYPYCEGTCVGEFTGGQTNVIKIPAGTDPTVGQIVYFDPLYHSGSFTITATPLINTGATSVFEQSTLLPDSKTVDATCAQDQPALEVCPQVVDKSGSPRTNWPLLAAIRIADDSIQGYSVVFTAMDGTGTPVKLAYTDNPDYSGVYNPDPVGTGKCFTSSATFKACEYKTYYYLVPDTDSIGKTLTITATLTGASDSSIVLTAVASPVGPFVKPDELYRVLRSDAWQAFSAPKVLAKPCVQFDKINPGTWGTFKDLGLPSSSYVVMYSAMDKAWSYVPPDAPIYPYVSYFVKTPQLDAFTENYTLKYVFARALDPSDTIPVSMMMYGPGWNGIGVGVSPTVKDTADLLQQSDYAYRALATVMDTGAMSNAILWNQGSGVANVATFKNIAIGDSSVGSWATDPNYTAYNGDAYWIYMSGSMSPISFDYTGEIGQDLVRCEQDKLT